MYQLMLHETKNQTDHLQDFTFRIYTARHRCRSGRNKRDIRYKKITKDDRYI
jgi:hypothetical protein